MYASLVFFLAHIVLKKEIVYCNWGRNRLTCWETVMAFLRVERFCFIDLDTRSSSRSEREFNYEVLERLGFVCGFLWKFCLGLFVAANVIRLIIWPLLNPNWHIDHHYQYLYRTTTVGLYTTNQGYNSYNKTYSFSGTITPIMHVVVLRRLFQ